MTVDYKKYSADKKAFFNKHKNNFDCMTTQMDQYGRYGKIYNFEDGAIWYENMAPTYETAEVMVKLVPIKVEVKMFRTEYYSTDDATSKYYYEKF